MNRFTFLFELHNSEYKQVYTHKLRNIDSQAPQSNSSVNISIHGHLEILYKYVHRICALHIYMHYASVKLDTQNLPYSNNCNNVLERY